MTKARDLSKSTLPAQSGNSGKYLTTDGTAQSWGTVPPAGGLTLISTTAMPTDSSTVTITGIPTTYNQLIFRFDDVRQSGLGAAGNANYFRLNGNESNSDYTYAFGYLHQGSPYSTGSPSTSAGRCFMLNSYAGFTYELNVYRANEAVTHYYSGFGDSLDANNFTSHGAHKPASPAAVSSFQFWSTNGNFGGGNILLYGVKY